MLYYYDLQKILQTKTTESGYLEKNQTSAWDDKGNIFMNFLCMQIVKSSNCFLYNFFFFFTQILKPCVSKCKFF